MHAQNPHPKPHGHKPLMTGNRSQPPSQRTTPSSRTVVEQNQTEPKTKMKNAPQGIHQEQKFRIITKVSLFSESFYPADDPEQTKTNGEQP